MPDEDDPLVLALAHLIAMREGRDYEPDHYACALDLITQMRGVGYQFVPVHPA